MAPYLENDPDIWKAGCLLGTCPKAQGIALLIFVYLQVLAAVDRPHKVGALLFIQPSG